MQDDLLLFLNDLKIERYTFVHTKKTKPIDLEYHSYMRSAIDEIKRYILESEDQNTFKILDDFRCLMDDFACSASTPNAGMMFSVYYEVATDVLDILLGTK